MVNRRGFTILELAVVAGIFLLLVFVLGPFVHMAKSRSNRIKCANNLMKISIGLHSYAVDHDGLFPENLAKLYPRYVDDEAAFDCPSSRVSGRSASPDYAYNPKASSTRDILAEDMPGNHRKNGRNMLRVDGSVSWAR